MVVNRTTFTTVADGNELSEGYFNGISTTLNTNINRYSNNLESSEFSNETGTIKYLSSTEALDFRGASGVYYTANNGTSWAQRSATNVGTTLYQNKSYPENIITATHYTSDGGTTWTTFTAQTTKTNRAYAIINGGAKLYALGKTGNEVATVYESVNDGGTWTGIKNGVRVIVSGGSNEEYGLEAPVDDVVMFLAYGGTSDDAETALTFDGFSTVEFQQDEASAGFFGTFNALYVDANNYFFDAQIADNTGGYAIKWRADLTNGYSSTNDGLLFCRNSSNNVYMNVIAFLPDRLIIGSADSDLQGTLTGTYRYCDGTEVFIQTMPTFDYKLIIGSYANTHVANLLSEDQLENTGGTTYLNRGVRKALIDGSGMVSW